jgi:hypothetical protein
MPESSMQPTEIPRFGDYLQEVMHTDGWSTERLAAKLEVDRSLVYRWRRSDCVPKLDTPYLDEIAGLLGLTPYETTTLEQAHIRTLREFGTLREPEIPRARRSNSLPRGDEAVRRRQRAFEAALEVVNRLPEASSACTGDDAIIVIAAQEQLGRTP